MLQLTFSGLKQVIHDQTRQNEYQTVTVPFSVYIHNLMFVFLFYETSFGAVVILPLITIRQLQLTFSGLRQLILDQTE